MKTKSEDNFNFEQPKFSSKEEGKEDNHSNRINELEKCMEATANRSNLQEAGVVKPYPAKRDIVPYLPKFKVPILQIFDGKGSPSQHIYYFKS